MSIDYVIDASNVSLWEYLQTLGFLEWCMLFFCCTAIGVIAGGFFFALAEHSPNFPTFFITFLVFFFGAFFALVHLNSTQGTPDGWEETIAQPYFNHLPLATKEIDIISVAGTDNPEIFNVIRQKSPSSKMRPHFRWELNAWFLCLDAKSLVKSILFI